VEGNSRETVVDNNVLTDEEIISSGIFSVYSTGHPDNDYFDLFVQYDLKGNPKGIMV